MLICLNDMINKGFSIVEKAKKAGVAYTELAIKAAGENGPDFHPSKILANGGSLFAVVYDHYSKELVVTEYTDGDDISYGIFFSTEEQAVASKKADRDLYRALFFEEFVDTYQTLDYDAVEKTAMALIDENGDTTTLEVKETLREQGYWATQQDVSELMQEVMFNKRLNVASVMTDGKLHLKFYKKA